jgi:hypothetical protein
MKKEFVFLIVLTVMGHILLLRLHLKVFPGNPIHFELQNLGQLREVFPKLNVLMLMWLLIASGKNLRQIISTCVQIHCMTDAHWTDKQKKQMDILENLKVKKIIRAHGVSVHSLDAMESLCWEPLGRCCSCPD